MTHSRFLSATSIVLACLICSAAVAYADPPELVPSSSGEDTEQLQAALTQCTQSPAPCNIRLGAGVFHTDVLLAKGFKGSITGKGQGATTIKPVLSRPLRSTLNPFFAPPTLAQPYPVLLHFTDGGKIALSGFTMDFPGSMRVTPYNHYLLGPDGLGITDYLQAAIMLEGDRSAELTVTHVTIRGRDKNNYWGSNLHSAVRFAGKLRFSGNYVNLIDRTQKLQQGRFVAHDNRLIRAGNGLWAEDINGTEGLFFDNEVDARIYGIIMVNAGKSKFQTLHNRIHAELDGVVVFHTLERPPENSSDYVIALNRIGVNLRGLSVEGLANDGIALFDDAAFALGQTGTMNINVDIWGNDIEAGINVYDGMEIFSDGPGKVRVFGNRIHGPLNDSGVWVEFSRGTEVFGNDFSRIDPPQGDVSLQDTTSQCRVYEPGDTVLNLGTHNQVVGVPVTAARAAAQTPRLRAKVRPGFTWRAQ